MSNTCDAKALLAHPDRTPGTSTLIAHCALPMDHQGLHEGATTMDGKPWPTQVSWDERDRRTFRGTELSLCDQTTCTLPAGHRGNHAP